MRYIGPMIRQKEIKDLDQRAVYLFGMTADVPIIVGTRHYHPHRLGTTKQPGNLNRSYKSSFPVAGASMVQIWWCAGQPAAGRLITDVELALQEADIDRMLVSEKSDPSAASA